jgi:hypothetical protein
MTHAPDLRANGISTNDYCKLLPRRRHTHEAQGKVLRLPSTGLVVVPFRDHKGGWDAVVVEGYGSYPVGGHHVYIGDAEIETATELALGEPLPVQIITTTEEAESLEDGTYVLTREHGSVAKSTVDGEIRWTRKAFGKVSLRTDELAAEFPLVVSGSQAKEKTSV